MNTQPQKNPQQNEKKMDPKQPPVRSSNPGTERDAPEEARKSGTRER